jgi:hypothetical protein
MSARVLLRAVRRGNWRFARLIAVNHLYGLTHRHCRQCGKYKGLSWASRCATCQMTNLMKALYDDSDTRELEEVFNLARRKGE